MIRGRLSYVLALGAGVVFYIYYKEWLSWFTLLLILSLPAVSLVLGWAAARSVKLTVHAEPPAAEKGDEVTFVVRFSNRGRFPVARAVFTLRLRNALGPWDRPRRGAVFLGGRSERTVAFTTSSLYAGKLECRVEGARCCDFLGLFTCKRLRTQEAWAFVMPKAVPILPLLDAEPVPDWDGEHIHPGKPGEDPSETIDIRAYQEGDSLRAIHWKRSGRTDELMVRVFAQPVTDAVELLLDLSGGMAEQDILLDALCSLHFFLARAGVAHRVTWFDAAAAELATQHITADEDWTGVLGAILSARGSRGAALSLRLGSDGGARSARVLYLCADYGKAEQDMLSYLENAVALVAAGNGAEIKDAYSLRRGSLGADLSRVTI